MTTDRLICDGCGAPLQVPCGARYSTCRFCDATLEIVRNDSTVTTRQIKQLAVKTTALDRRVGRLEAIERGDVVPLTPAEQAQVHLDNNMRAFKTFFGWLALISLAFLYLLTL